MELKCLLEAILAVSEKATVLARAIRSEHSLFELLIEEKSSETKNKRFVHDFKTLADVLVQELVKYDLSRQFPGIEDNIFGEESNKFTNTLGESVTVQIKENPEDMTELLSLVLDGNHQAASLLTEVIHGSNNREPASKLREPDTERPQDRIPDHLCIDTNDLALWIDPIDSTAQYIHGYESKVSENGIYVEGLQCSVILIGVYHRGTGSPLLGVVNQPFHTQTDKQWSGRTVWGLSHNGVNISSLPLPSQLEKPVVVQSTDEQSICQEPLSAIILSPSEDATLQRNLSTKFQLVYAAGAGYKQLCVVDSLVSAYVLSKGSTFKWDTCATHAILKSLGGGIVDFNKALELVRRKAKASNEEILSELCDLEVVYDRVDREDIGEGEKWSNAGGILAYIKPEVVVHIARATKE